MTREHLEEEAKSRLSALHRAEKQLKRVITKFRGLRFVGARASLDELARCKELNATKKELSSLREWVRGRCAFHDELLASNNALRAEVSSLKKDLAASLNLAPPKRFTCAVCLGVEPNVLLRPCHHVCEACLQNIAGACSVCRAPVEAHELVFIV